MKNVCSPYFDPEFENLIDRFKAPRVCIDNESCQQCTVVKVDSGNKQSLLLDVVQVLTDIDLVILKGYISYDAGWLMDVFHVTDQMGKKLTDERLINYIEKAIGCSREAQNQGEEVKTCTGRIVGGSDSTPEHTAIEMTGTDRPGLLSEISAVLTELGCNVVEGHAWTHNTRLACVLHVCDQYTAAPIDDPDRLADIKDHLSTVVRANDSERPGVETEFSEEIGTHAERRLHQLMFADRDYEWPPQAPATDVGSGDSVGDVEEEEARGRTVISIDGCNEKGYSVVSVRCRDRPKLMFDTVCTLTDMQYMVFHATINCRRSFAFQEYYIRYMDGRTMDSEGEKERVIKCLEAAIERRVCEGVRLELCAYDRVGLLSDITRLLRENGLAVARADVAKHGEKTVNVFYVRDVSGNSVDMKVVDSMRREMGPVAFKVKNERLPRSGSQERSRFSIGDMLRTQIERISNNFISIS